jgi:hypothetical protein
VDLLVAWRRREVVVAIALALLLDPLSAGAATAGMRSTTDGRSDTPQAAAMRQIA